MAAPQPLSPAASGQTSLFRMKILARLLGCRSATARLLKDATSLALQLALREMGATPASSHVYGSCAVVAGMAYLQPPELYVSQQSPCVKLIDRIRYIDTF